MMRRYSMLLRRYWFRLIIMILSLFLLWSMFSSSSFSSLIYGQRKQHIVKSSLLQQSHGKEEKHSVEKKSSYKLDNIVINPYFEEDTHSELFSLKGWWIDDPNMNKTRIYRDNCFNGESIAGRCSGIALRFQCTSNIILAAYQFIAFSTKFHESLIGFEFGVKSASSGMQKRKTMGKIGMEVQVVFTDGSSNPIHIGFRSGTHGFLYKSQRYFIPRRKSIRYIAIMLMCSGYQGHMWFDDIEVIPIVQSNISLIEECPPSVPVPKLPSMQAKVVMKGTPTSHAIVTLVTQVSVDRLLSLKVALMSWDGAISVAVYVPMHSGYSFEKVEAQATAIIDHTFGTGVLRRQCDVVLLYASNEFDEFPVNRLRNMALLAAKTDFLFLLDGDFVPSSGFNFRFKRHLANGLLEKFPSSRTAFVAPAFELISEEATSATSEIADDIDLDGDGSLTAYKLHRFIEEITLHLPTDKASLKSALGKGDVRCFQSIAKPIAHESTNYSRWLTAQENEVYFVEMKNDHVKQHYEPYVVIRRDNNMPLFDERFTGFGMNKVTFLFELAASGYSFAVIPDVFVVHLPHKKTSYYSDFLGEVSKRFTNRCLRFEFMVSISRKYLLGGCKSTELLTE